MMPGDYTPRQGQYLAFIYYYTKLNSQPPAETDMQRILGPRLLRCTTWS